MGTDGPYLVHKQLFPSVMQQCLFRSQALAVGVTLLLSAVVQERLVWGGCVTLGPVIGFGLPHTFLWWMRKAFQASKITLSRTLAYTFGLRLAKHL